MKAIRNSLFYITTIGVFALVMWLVIRGGQSLESGAKIASGPLNIEQTVQNRDVSGSTGIFESVMEFIQKPLAILILQITIILILSRLFGYLSKKIKQPSVIGEIVAGIVLGPSILGALSPQLFAFIFPVNSIEILHALSQVGLILFMFIVGMELDFNVLKRSAGIAVMVSHASIIFPFALGVGLSYFLYTDFAPANVSFLAFSLFTGTAMSITALPILARIIQERGLTNTKLGTMAFTCGAIDDITAWGILAAVIAIVHSGSWLDAGITLILSVIYISLMVWLVRPFLKKVGRVYITRETLSKQVVAVIFIILLLSAFITEVIGIHALIGAFFAGIIMPKTQEFKKNVIEKIEDVSLVLLMPLFFAFTGLRTEIGLLNEWNLWIVFFQVLIVAVVGKFVGTALAARFGGLSWEISLSLGTLMNTRGLIMLIVLNIGYDFGVISPEMFAIMVLMALITTFMTGPALSFIQYLFKKAGQAEEETAIRPYRIMIAFGPPRMGSVLLNLSRIFLPQNNHEIQPGQISALHLTPSAEVHPTQAAVFEKESFEPVLSTANQCGISLNTIYKVTDDVQSEIIRSARKSQCDLLLLGSAKSIFTSDLLGGKIRRTLHESPCNVGILVDHDFSSATNVIVHYPESPDRMFFALVQNLLQLPSIDTVTIVQQNHNADLEAISALNNSKIRMTDISGFEMTEPAVGTYDLIVVHVNDWKDTIIRKMMKFEKLPSVLILKSRA